MKKKIAALCAALCVMSLAAGCGKKEDVLDKNDPVTITVWNYYNGAQLDSFNELVEKFNSTVGKEKGIKVEAASQGSVDDLQKNVMDSINGIAGAEEMPNIFAAYADTAYEIDQMGKLANLRDYFTEDELNDMYEDMSPDERAHFCAMMDALAAEGYEARMGDLAKDLYGGI